MAQLFSNLLGNALIHGAPGKPIRVVATTTDHFELSVENSGEPIPQAVMDRIFQPFYRADVYSNVQGLGLGLFIAAQIANVHGGKLDVTSDETATRFTFRMPILAAATSRLLAS
jgi:signal transduction histidine kinase